jgi:hypothetical protein
MDEMLEEEDLDLLKIDIDINVTGKSDWPTDFLKNSAGNSHYQNMSRNLENVKSLLHRALKCRHGLGPSFDSQRGHVPHQTGNQ